MKSLESYIPSEAHCRRIQANIPIELAEKADKIRKARCKTWGDIMTGLLQKLVDDMSPTAPAPKSYQMPKVELDTDQSKNLSFWK